MKRFFILVSTMLAACAMSACSPDNTSGNNDGDNNPSGQNGNLTMTIVDGTYYGELYGEGVGFYSITFSNNNGDVLRVDCYGSVSTNARNARLTSGDYKPGDISSLTPRVFVTASSGSDERGTIYWHNNQAYPIDGGSMTVQASGSVYTIKFNFTSNDEQINAYYNGEFTLVNQAAVAPRPKDPNPRPVSEFYMSYEGRSIYNPDNAYIGLIMYYKGSSDSNNNIEALQLTGYIPIQEDANNVYLAEGTYPITTDGNKADNTLEGGAVVASGVYGGSYEFTTTSSGNLAKAYLCTEGALTVTKNDNGQYTVTAKMTGYRADKAGIIDGTPAEDIVYEYVGNLPPMLNNADGPSNRTEGQNMGVFSGEAMCQAVHHYYTNAAKQLDYSMYLYYIWGEGLDITLGGNGINVDGSGPMIMLCMLGDMQENTPPTGYYPMGETYGFVEHYWEMDWGIDDENIVGIAWPGNPYYGNDINPQEGCWFTSATSRQGGGLNLDNYAAAAHGKGYVKTYKEDDNECVEFELYDKNGYKFTGTYKGHMIYNDATSATSGASAASGKSLMYVPAVTMHDVVAPVSFIRNF